MSKLSDLFSRTADQMALPKLQALLSSVETTGTTKRGKAAKRARDVANDEEREGVPSSSIEVVEVVDIRKLKILFDNRKTLLENQQQQTLLAKYYANALKHNGRRPVLYKQKHSGDHFGRFSPQEGMSLQNIRKEIRSTIASHLYQQLDITNAHPWILLSLTEQLGWDTPNLQYYVTHRNEVRSMFSANPAIGKKIMLMIIYGGMAEHALGGALPDFVEEFRRELYSIAMKLYDIYPQLVKRLRSDELDDHKRYYSFLSKILQDREAKCLIAAVEFLRKEGWQPGALLHDGLLVLNRSDAQIDDNCLDRLMDYIKDQTSMKNIRFQLKEFEPGFDISKFETDLMSVDQQQQKK